MATDSLEILDLPELHDATLLVALTGWMDGGAVSTGTLRSIMEGRSLSEIAHIRPDAFYIYNFPGTMEVTALFRPEVRMKKGLIRELDMPIGTFMCDPAANLVFFVGKEPNLRWQEFSDCMFEIVHAANVKRIIFMGSFGGTVPQDLERDGPGRDGVRHPYDEGGGEYLEHTGIQDRIIIISFTAVRV
jgi:hypothetical protein